MLSSSNIHMLPLSLALLLLSPTFAHPTPSIDVSELNGRTVSLTRKPHNRRTPEDWEVWAKNHRDGLINKYGGVVDGSSSTTRRSTGTNLLTNQNTDSSFYGSLAVGTPPVSYDVILDTGSADLWLASSSCTTSSGCDSDVATFDASSSSTFKNSSQSFSITYGSGQAAGSLGTDTVRMAGFEVQSQTFASVYAVTSGLLTSPVSGLLGLAFSTIASSKAQTFWQAASSTWDSPLMSFHLTRFINDTSASSLEFGGSFTMGGTDTSLYTGDIDYVDIPENEERYWNIPLRELTVNGNTVSGLPSISSDDSLAAIDTGTTLVGGPADLIALIYAQIDGAQKASGNYDGYWYYPCSSDVTVTMAYGESGKAWTISPADFMLAQLSRTTCLGSFFELNTGSSAPAWIVGDTFLKNVYSVYRLSPASVGFAQLSSAANALSDGSQPVPSATVGSAAATATAKTGSSSNNNNSASSLVGSTQSMALSSAMAIVALFFVL